MKPRTPSTRAPAPTAGEKVIRELARAIVSKAVRLRNKAHLVQSEQGRAGRNLTALKNTAQEMLELCGALLDRRCRVCGRTDSDPVESDRCCLAGDVRDGGEVCTDCAGKE